MIGQQAQIASFKAAFESGHPHHAWLLAGPKGVGKSSFAHAAAKWVLVMAAMPETLLCDGFAVDPKNLIGQLVDAGTHPDFRVLTKLINPTTGKERQEILVAQIVFRKDSGIIPLRDVFKSTPAMSAWRIVIIDSVDDLAVSGSNALLKNLEEPPAGTVFFLISHTPGRLLPTIRSRCRTLRFARLADADVDAVLADAAPTLDDADRATLVRIAAGAPGRALRFAESGIAALEEQLTDLATTPSSAAAAKALALARSFAGKANGPRYEAMLELAPAMLAAAARGRRGSVLARTLADWEAAQALAGSAMALSLDPQSVGFDLAQKIARLASA